MRGLVFIPSVFLAIFASSNVFSQTSNTIETKTETTKEKSLLSDFSLSLSTNFYTDLKETSDNSKQNSGELETTLGYKINDKTNISIYTPITKDLSSDFKEEVGDIRISLDRSGLFKYKNLSTSFRLTSIVPITDDSKLKDRLNTGIELNLINTFDLDRYVPGLSFTYIPRYRRNFHEFETDRTGANLREQSFFQILSLGLQINDKWSLGTTLAYVNSIGYNSATLAPAYLTTVGLGYELNSTTSFTVGTTTGGRVRRFEKGPNQNIKFFDKDTTQFVTGANLRF